MSGRNSRKNRKMKSTWRATATENLFLLLLKLSIKSVKTSYLERMHLVWDIASRWDNK